MSDRRPTASGELDEVNRFFSGRREALAMFRAVKAALPRRGVTMSVSKSQIRFSRRRGFAWVWTPDRWLKGEVAPLVLSVSLTRKDTSKRWKEIVKPSRDRWMHHLELHSARDVDVAVRAWLAEAWAEAGEGR